MVDEMIQNWWNFHYIKSKSQQRMAMSSGINTQSAILLRQVLIPALRSLSNLYPKYPIYSPLLTRTIILDFAYIHAGQKINFERDHCLTMDDYKQAQRRDRYLLTQGWRVVRYHDEDFGYRLPQTLAMTHKLLYATSSTPFDLYEQAIIQYAVKSKQNIFRISEILSHLNIGRDRLRPILRRLYEKKILLCVGENLQRIHRYQLNTDHEEIQRFFHCS